MPRYSVEPRPNRRTKIAEQSKLDLAQQSVDQNQLNDYMGFATNLYGLQKDRAMQPEVLRGARLQNDAQEFENAWAQPMAEARYNATQALAGQRNDKVGISPQEAAMLVQSQIWTPDQAREALMSPAEKTALAQQKAAAEATRQQAIAADQAQQTKTPPTPSSSYANAQELGAALEEGLYNMPSTVYNVTGTGWDYLAGLLGIPIRSARMRPLGTTIREQRAGRHYPSIFYDPQDATASFPIPTARPNKP